MDSIECSKVLSSVEFGNLAMIDGENPYQVPVSYAWMDDKVYVHSSPKGHKLECLRRNPNVCFQAAQYFRDDKNRVDWKSVIITGKARIIEDMPTVIGIMRKFADNYAGVSSFHEAMKKKDAATAPKGGHPGNIPKPAQNDMMDKEDKFGLVIIEITPENIAGKKRISFTENK